jgi:hypothetical protein
MWLRELVSSGTDVACVYLTDGGFGGQAVECRERESLAALARLGVMQSRVRFLGREHGIRDGVLPEALDRAWHALEAFVGEAGPYERIIVPAWEGGHQDHDATHLLGAVLGLRRGAEVQQFPLYNGYRLPGPFFRVLHPLPANGPVSGYRAGWAERVGAVRLCFTYLSQWKTWLGLLPFFTLQMAFSGVFPRQPAGLGRLSERPHEGALLYERRGAYAYSRFRETADGFMTVNAACETGA